MNVESTVEPKDGSYVLKSEGHSTMLNLPVYDLSKQLDFITSVCESCELNPPNVLVSLILADWTCRFQTRSKEIGYPKALIEFLNTSQSTYKTLCEYSDHVAEVLNEQTDR